jgi:hypothetical protein
MKRPILTLTLLPLVLGQQEVALAVGHGPTFGLATPTLGEGAWQFDAGWMQRAGSIGDRSMLRSMVSYGITPDLQVSLTTPWLLEQSPLVTARGAGMMPASPALEGLVGWRFHRQEPGVGQRFESTVYLGG